MTLRDLHRDTVSSVIASAILGVALALAEWTIEDKVTRTIIVAGALVLICFVVSVPVLLRVARDHTRHATIRQLVRRSSIQHFIVHQARDLCVKLLPPAEPYSTGKATDEPHPALEANRDTIICLLEHMVRLFQTVTPPDVRLWACIRDRRGDDCYHTFARAGHYNPNREIDSRPMHKDKSKTITRLKQSYSSGSCVIITGSAKGPEMWEGQENDKFREDRCVLMGAVMTKSFNPDQSGGGERWSNKKLAWMLCVCADADNVFQEEHIPLMQSCVDSFSMIANVVLRTAPAAGGIANGKRRRS